MEGVDDIVESEPSRGAQQRVITQLAAIKGAAGVEEFARLGRCLLVDELQVLAQVPGEGRGQFLQRHTVIGAVGESEKRLRQSELVGGHVAAEQDDSTPVGVESGGLGEKIGQAAAVQSVAIRASLSLLLRQRVGPKVRR